MKLGITSGYFTKYGVAEGAKRLKAHGYDCADYQNFINTETDFFKLPEKEFEKILLEEKKIVADAGIFIHQTHGPWRRPQDATEADRAERFDSMSKAIRGTAYLGCENIVVHPLMPFGSHSDAEPKTQWDINLEFMSRLAEVGKEYAVTVCFENMPFRELPLSPVSEILRMVREINSDYFGVCLDTGHAAAIGDSPADAVRLLGKKYLRVMHVHDNDGKRDYHWLPGTGVINWNDFSEALFDIKYEGALVLETGVSRFAKEGEDTEAAETELACFVRKLARKDQKE